MSVPLGNTANRFTGIREQSQVTNSYSGYLQSGGVAYNLSLPFFPDKFEWVNYTRFGDTTAVNVSGVWYRGMPAGASLINLQTVTTNALVSLKETTNGITDATVAGGFYNEHLVITGITTASPGKVTTSTAHNLSDFDRVVLTKIVGTAAAQLNNNTYVVRVVDSDEFTLYDTFGVPINVTGAYSSGGQVTKIGPLLGNPSQPVSPAFPHKAIIDYPPLVQLTLGSAIMGLDNNVIYFTAWQFNNYVNRGDVA